MVVQHLPAGCGPAFVGTPEELAADVATTQQMGTAPFVRRHLS
ncbi:hypothetical protein L1085_001485 [Streptomyces sp. MSC1_001]